MSYLMAIGTKKGLFTATSDDRVNWDVTGPHRLGGDASTVQTGVYAIGIDTRRDTPRLFVGADSSHFGPSVWHSDDAGATWSEPADAPPIALPEDTDTAFARAWQFGFGPEPDVVFASGEPHSLFKSTDGGVTFELNRGLWDHPHRTEWFPGFGGAAIHTIMPHPTDPAKMSVAMSTGGFYQTEDGGASWNPTCQGIRADFFPEPYPEFGQCVHKAVRAAGDPSRFYLQNHGGVYRSDDGGHKWNSIAEGLPCDFGFAMVAHPHRTDSVLSFPVHADANRFLPDNRLQVHRSDDGGSTWREVSQGLPTEPYFGIVLRDAAATDAAEVPGYYFGTRCGDVFVSTEDSENWVQAASHLPDVLCVRAARM
ncbi:WD40/YVTN/BNR-like repeat-containing protein [Stackebrandtia nassauensis]|uniref:Glycosyl hydrolase BNR repeat-containing glycosyl hydrolase n=1 Tax=Stackebrandtia nassauensis (strain DSM 44728 / CIP 108903 / NRRL B-16338 / NBRC 102104 / LLR-40K-21) TaxID=446470 RepID=D3Q3U2_STANL|nr:glycosyl hydrolase [Stackebrandtia nassauensis]ADD44009.1 glycosyl hydrolase BNR repeat-containing glycosyl hydrolase [Stackebrandtia nassauensis DSM 44728]